MKYVFFILLSVMGCGKSNFSSSPRKNPKNLELHVIPQTTPSQKPHYDTEKKEGVLELLIEYPMVGEAGSLSLTNLRSAYLYTQYDQSQLDYPFDNAEALIYLNVHEEKKGGLLQRIEVGRYLPALDYGVLSHSATGVLPLEYWNSHRRWITPRLCEGEYATVCHIEVKIKKSRSVFTPNQQISVFLYLGEEKKPAYEATSKKELP
jgi:hypothetical protein